MPIVGISITKEVAFRDSVQPFSNVYYYNNGVGSVPDAAGALALIDEIVAFEKTIHSSLVTFTFGRCWHQTLTEIGTVMIGQKALSGTGSSSADSGMDKERAFLFRWRAGNDSRGNPVYLRKYWHCCGLFASASGAISSAILANATGFTGAAKTAMENKAAEMTDLAAAGGGWELCAKSGRGHDFNTPNSHPYLEHHQLGDQWRGD